MVLRLLLLSLILTACDSNLKEGSKTVSATSANRADVTISSPTGTAQATYLNLNDQFYLRCRRDQKGLMYIDARQTVKLSSGELVQQWFSLWFPIPASSEKKESSAFSAAQGVQIYGNVVFDSQPIKLGSDLKGQCHTSLSRTGDLIKGEVLCLDFASDGNGRLDDYDLRIENLSCFFEN